ncbi:response regulator transcription factor [Williamsia muralis]|uniref:response regulator transcription factor n=1 Tax=Williamsia marianensis TaxID=85044 RepID=UPI0037F55C25
MTSQLRVWRGRIGVVDDHPSIVAGLRALLDEQPDLCFVAGAATVPELLEQTHDLDLVILDLRLDDGSSPQSNVEALLDLDIPAIAYTSGDEAYLVRLAASAGVRAVLRKNVSEEELLKALRAALSGQEAPTVDWAAAIDADEDFVDLSPQLRRVLELYATGESTAGVAKAMDLSPETVADYVGRIRRKYVAVGRPAPTRSHLVLRAIEDGWLPIPRRIRRKR